LKILFGTKLYKYIGSVPEPANTITARVCACVQGYPLERGISIRLADLIKRSKAQQFHGLMGRSSGKQIFSSLFASGNKGEMFVGLMGRRSLGEGKWECQTSVIIPCCIVNLLL
uniref:Uncharacterized protein n=1 Tax=Salarias fasciatus TaxID=181472 RepID=A0A672G7L1_SALFA